MTDGMSLDPVRGREGLIVKPFRVSVEGFDSGIYFARSRGKALAAAWQEFCSYRDDVDFKAFMSMARCKHDTPGARFGEHIKVGGKPAFYVSHNSQYIQFVRPDSDVVLHSHPLDVEPTEARRGTPYANHPPTKDK